MSTPSAPSYPELRTKSDAVLEIRLKEINKILTRLEKDIKVRKGLSKKYKRLYNGLHSVSIGSTALNTGIAGSALIFMTNPVTLLPLVITNLSLGAISIITGVVSKLTAKKIKKHEKLYILSNSMNMRINEILTESLKDNVIDDREFKRVLNEYQDYLKTDKNVKDTYINRTFVEKEEVKAKLNELFNQVK